MFTSRDSQLLRAFWSSCFGFKVDRIQTEEFQSEPKLSLELGGMPDPNAFQLLAIVE